MSLGHGASVVRDGLVLNVDAANPKCYNAQVSTNRFYDVSNYAGADRSMSLYGTTLPTVTNGYFSFDGVDQSAGLFGDNYQWTVDMPITIEVLFRAKSFPSLQYTGGSIFGQGLGNQLLIQLQPSATNTTEINVCYDDSRYNANHNTNYSISLNEWVHFTFLGIPNGDVTGDLEYYVNGSLDKARFTSSDPDGPNTTSAWLIARSGRGYLGDGSGNAGDNFLHGHIDVALVRMYNRNLSEAEIRQNFEATRGRFGI